MLDESNVSEHFDPILILNNLSSYIDKFTDVTSDGGVKKRILSQGTGDIVFPGASVEVHYSAFHSQSSVSFDSTRLRHRTFSVSIPDSIDMITNTAMKGIEIGITSMRLNEESIFILQPEYAMGAQGCYPRVPPNSTCLVNIFVLSVENFPGALDYEQMPMAEKQIVDFEIFHSAMMRRKNHAKRTFESKNYQRALDSYKKILNYSEQFSAKDHETDLRRNKLLTTILNNMALCYLNLGLPLKTIKKAEEALSYDKKNSKANYYKAKAYRLVGNLDEAEKALKLAKQAAPYNSEICAEFSNLEKEYSMLSRVSKEKLKNNLNPVLQKNDVNDDRMDSKPVTSAVTSLIDATIQRFINDDEIKDFAFTSDYFSYNELMYIKKIASQNEIETYMEKQEQSNDDYILKISK